MHGVRYGPYRRAGREFRRDTLCRASPDRPTADSGNKIGPGRDFPHTAAVTERIADGQRRGRRRGEPPPPDRGDRRPTRRRAGTHRRVHFRGRLGPRPRAVDPVGPADGRAVRQRPPGARRLRGGLAPRPELPHDLSVAGFDDIDNSLWCCPPMTTVRQPPAEMGATAARMLMTLAAGDTPVQTRVEPATTLVERDSASTPEA
ncbi:substrate-binding domain-containing protein [Saccharothrix isguenensis]